MAPSLICAWIRLDPPDRDAFLEFHDREHIPERLAVPGFRSGRRFVSVDDPNRFLLVYEVEAISVLTSPAYLARQNAPTEWTRRSLPMIREPRRLAIDLDDSRGDARGGVVGLIHLARLPVEHLSGLRAQALALIERRGVVAVHVARVDLVASNMATVERDQLGNPVEGEGIVILVEATEEAALSDALAAIPVPAGVTAEGLSDAYRLQSSLSI